MEQSEKKEKMINCLERTYHHLKEGHISMAVEYLHMQLENFGDLGFMDPFINTANEYFRMSEYWVQGFPDPQREQMFNQSRIKLLKLADRYTVTLWNTSDNNYLRNKGENLRKKGTEWSWESVRKRSEEYVVNLTMTTLDGELLDDTHPSERQWVIHEEHQKYREQVFDYIVTSTVPLTQSDAEQLRDLLESPMVDSVDQQLIVAALTLNVMRLFDIRTFRLLIHVYRHSSIMEVRQRALVGWVFALGWMRQDFYPEIRDIVGRLTQNQDVKKDLTNLQLQLLTTVDAEVDGKKLSKALDEDMPNFRQMNMKAFSTEEVKSIDDLDRMLGDEKDKEDLLEQYMAAVNLQKDMREKGTDIYFEGFKMMKQFPFFGDMCNWFMPFIMTHPALRRLKSRDIMQFFRINGYFCDSDMYSLIMSLDNTMSALPPAVLERLKNPLTEDHAIAGMNEQQKKMLNLRNYLESFYRFFKLFRYRSSFQLHCPFPDKSLEEVNGCDEIPELLFTANPVICNKDNTGLMLDTVRFLIKKKCYPLASEFFVRIPYDSRLDNKVYLTTLARLTLLKQPTVEELGLNKTDILRKAFLIYPESKVICKALARQLKQEGQYEEAMTYFETLAGWDPDSPQWPIETAKCLIGMKDYTKAQDTLFKIRYEYEDEQEIPSLIAECKMQLGDPIEAFQTVQTALRSGNTHKDTYRLYAIYTSANSIKGQEKIVVGKALLAFVKYLQIEYTQDQLDDETTFLHIMDLDFRRSIEELIKDDDRPSVMSLDLFMKMAIGEIWKEFSMAGDSTDDDDD